jgi:exosortase F-associated protein
MHLRKSYRILILLLLFFALVLVRGMAPKLFYDPFIDYFRNDYLREPIPAFSGRKLLLHMAFRYGLNSLISLAMIYVAFLNRDFVMFSARFFMVAFVILATTYFIILRGELENGYLFAFYVRRFLIHPLFVLILLPAFYYKQLISREII